MESMVWSPAMELGNPVLDAAHRELFDEMLRLGNAPDSELRAGFPVLADRMERDFREEEALMETIEYPGIKEHREQHARVLSALHHVDVEDVAAARECLELLPQWFEVHLATMDTALAVGLDLASSPG